MHSGVDQGRFLCIRTCIKIRQQEKRMLPLWVLRYWLLWLELKSTMSILLNSVPHSNVIISWFCVSTDTNRAHLWPDFASVMLSDVSLTFQCPADKLWGDAFNLIDAAQVQWPAHFGAVDSPQSNRHTKSSGLIRLPHASIKMFTCAYARNGLNLIWVMCGLLSFLISVGLAS
jgi:hypothetical protein